MGGHLDNKADVEGKPSVGIKSYWSWIAPKKLSKQSESANDDSEVAVNTQTLVPQEVTDALVENPQMSGATLINWLKANGFEIKKKV
jgi:hypothetical protein